MLVLSRKRNQSILIGSNISLSVISVAGNRVQIGIDAPIELPIVRGERPHSTAAASHADEVKQAD